MSSQGTEASRLDLLKRSGRVTVSLFLLCAAIRAEAANTGISALEITQGSGADRSNGDYVSAANGLDDSYSYYVEVPPGLSRVDIDVFDADIGMGGSNEGTRDRQRNNSWNTSARYRVFDPLGHEQTTRFSIGNRTSPAGADNAWLNLISLRADPGPVLPGHWEVRVDSSSAVTTGNDVNGFALRAHDGNAGAGGRELNLYAPSLGSYGANLSDVTSDYNQHPYVTAGCDFSVNDFDFDTEQNPLSASIALESPSGSFTRTVDHPSTNDAWLQSAISGWATDAGAEYGAWTMTTRISGPSGAGNYSNVYLGDAAASSPPPNAQPVPHSFRIYAARDDGAAPLLPTVEQHLEVVSGPNPPLVGATTRYRILVEVSNPGAGALDVRQVAVVVPGAGVTYAAGSTLSHGALQSQPDAGQSGQIVWVPGLVAAGTVAQLTYKVDVAPTAANLRLPLVGSASAGTSASFVDETCGAASPACTGSQLARATYGFGPLCAIAVTSGATAATATPIPTATNTPVVVATAPQEPPATATSTLPPSPTRTVPATATFTPVPTLTLAATDTPTSTVTATETSTPQETSTAEPTPTRADDAEPQATPTIESSAPGCGNGVVDDGEECDLGAANSDTTPDTCRTSCTLPRCGDGVPDRPVVDFVIVIETSLSMRNDLERLVNTLGPLPEQFAAAGVDYRLAVIRFGTGRLHKGPDFPEVLLDFTTDGSDYRARIDQLKTKLTGPTEAGTEAFTLALDSLAFRANAIPVFLLFTDENDDLPISIERRARREPPGRSWLTSARRGLFQARIDDVARRLIDLHARVVLLVNPRSRPTEFQYGSPRSTVVDDAGHLDMPATRSALAAIGAGSSLQGQLLAAGGCQAGLCVEGRTGFSCTADDDCGLPARAYEITQARDRNSEAFFQALREEVVAFGNCAP